MGYSLEGIPQDLLTSRRLTTRRLRVEVAETGFHEGREFRISEELDIPAGETLVYRFTSPVNFILQQQTLSLDGGAVRFRAFRDSQGAEGGTFDPALALAVNIMSDNPDYTGRAAVASGGTFTPDVGELAVETIRIRTSGSTAQRSTVTGGAADQRGLSAGTYYLLLESIGNAEATGVFDLKWEERE